MINQKWHTMSDFREIFGKKALAPPLRESRGQRVCVCLPLVCDLMFLCFLRPDISGVWYYCCTAVQNIHTFYITFRRCVYMYNVLHFLSVGCRCDHVPAGVHTDGREQVVAGKKAAWSAGTYTCMYTCSLCRRPAPKARRVCSDLSAHGRGPRERSTRNLKVVSMSTLFISYFGVSPV